MKFEEFSVLMNRNFAVFVDYIDDKGKRVHMPVGYAGLYALVGENWCHKLILRAFNAGVDKCTFKLRRGLRIYFRSK